MRPLHLGILGGGQLAQMLALAALPLGVRVTVLEPDQEAPARLCAEHLQAPYTDPQALARLARCDAVTLEFENVPGAALEALADRVPVRPGAALLHTSKNRLREKAAFEAIGARVAPHVAVREGTDLAAALEAVGGQGLLKTAELGYDGKGQRRVGSVHELQAAFDGLQVECVLEGLVPFVRELSLGVARSPSGEIAFGPLVENMHRDGILRRSHFVPGADPEAEAQARDIVRRAAESWGLEGLMTVEFFQLADGSLIVNEVAPRVHNSGHLTQDGGGLSQFEVQLRAALDLPIRDFAPLLPCGMLNILGWGSGGEPDWQAILKRPWARLHLYHKANRPGRKLGHLNVVAPDAETLRARLDELEGLLDR